MTDDQDTIIIDPAWSGRNGQVTLTARQGSTVLHLNQICINKADQRAKFIDDLCKGRPGIGMGERQQLRAELLALAVSHKKSPTSDAALLGELDSTRIVRPERFIRPEASGITVPVVVDGGGRPVGRWALYVRWHDGRRERRDLPLSLDCGDSGKLWITPQPSEPGLSATPGWSAQGRKAWLEGEPAPSPVDVYSRLVDRIDHYVDMPEHRAAGYAAMLALWVMFTYVFHAWPSLPYLFVGGPAGSGKTRVFDLLGRLCFRPFMTSSATGPTIYRNLHDRGGTLLLDEAERLREQTPDVGELRANLLAGYKKGGKATRLEPLGDRSFKMCEFDVFGPKAMACITGLPPALASRCIPLVMFRSAPTSPKPRRRLDDDPAWQTLRDDLHSLVLEHGEKFLEASAWRDICPAMSGRDYELMQPLLALTAWLDGEGADGLFELMTGQVVSLLETSRDDSTPDADEILLRILAEKIEECESTSGFTSGWPQAKSILSAAQAIEAETFKRWSAQGVGRTISRYGVRATKHNGRREYRCTVEDLKRIGERYNLDLGLDNK